MTTGAFSRNVGKVIFRTQVGNSNLLSIFPNIEKLENTLWHTQYFWKLSIQYAQIHRQCNFFGKCLWMSHYEESYCSIHQQNLTHYTLYTHDTCHMLTDQSAWRSFLYMQQTIDIPNAVDEAWYWLKHIIVHL